MIFAIAAALLSTIGTTSRIGDLDDDARVVTNVDESAVLTKSFSNDVGTVTFSPARFGDKAVWAADNDVVSTNFVPYTETNVVTYVDAVTNIVVYEDAVTNIVTVTNAVESTAIHTNIEQTVVGSNDVVDVKWYKRCTVYGHQVSRGPVTNDLFTVVLDTENVTKSGIYDSNRGEYYLYNQLSATFSGYFFTGFSGTWYKIFYKETPPSYSSMQEKSSGQRGGFTTKTGSGAGDLQFAKRGTVRDGSDGDTYPDSYNVHWPFRESYNLVTTYGYDMSYYPGFITFSYSDPGLSVTNTVPIYGYVTNYVEYVVTNYVEETYEIITDLTVTNITDLVITNMIPRVSTNLFVSAVITRPLVSSSGVMIAGTNGSVSTYSPGSESGFTEFSNAVASVTASRKMKPGHNVILKDDNGDALSVDVDPARVRSSVSLSQGYELNVPSVDRITVGGTVENGRRVGGRTYARELQDYLDLKSSSLRDLTVSNANALGSAAVDLAVMSDKDGNSVVFRDAKYRRSGSELRYADGGVIDVTRSLTMAGATYDVWVNLDEEGSWRKVGSISWEGTMSASPNGDRLSSCTFTHLDTDSMDRNTMYPFFKPGTTNRYTVAEIEDAFPAISHPYFYLEFSDEDTAASFVGGDGRRIWVDYFTWYCSGFNVTNGNPCVIEAPRLTGIEAELSFRCEPQKVSIKYVMVGHPTSVTSEYDGQVMSTESVNSGRTPVHSIFGETDSVNQVTGDGSVVKRSDPFAITMDFDIRYYGTFSGISKSVVLYPNFILMDQATRDVNAAWIGHQQYSGYPLVVVKYEGPVVGTGKWSSFRYLNSQYDKSNLSVSYGTFLSPPSVFTNANFVTGDSSRVYIGDCHTEVLPGSSYAKTSSAVFTTNVVSSITTDRVSVRVDGSNFIGMMDSVMATPSLKGSFSNAVCSVSSVTVKDGTNTPWTVSYSNDVFYLVR